MNIIYQKLLKKFRSQRTENPLNILTFPTHERYETQLAKTGHNFYAFQHPKAKRWNYNQLLPPKNYHILIDNGLPEYIDYDMMLVQSKFGQFQLGYEINKTLGIPMIVLEHTLPTPNVMPKEKIDSMREMIGNVNVFISEYSMREWGISNGLVIHHGLDTETFNPEATYEDGSSLDRWINEGGSQNAQQRGNYILTVANDFKNRDYCLNYKGWERVTKGLNTRVIGDNPGWTLSAESTEALAAEYAHAGVYFNSTTISPIPTTLLEAMACGCPVVSTATCMIPQIIKNGYNGFISNDEDELHKYLVNILNNKELANELGRNARKTIIEQFSEDRFIKDWNYLFQKVYEVSK
jgi:glycosyltransferase involved in cell wall biosynthesis